MSSLTIGLSVQNKKFKIDFHDSHLGFPIGSLSYFRSRGHPVATVCFNSNSPMVWEKSNIGFQDGSYGSHFGFPIGMILAIFHLHCYIVSFNLFTLRFERRCPKQLFKMAAVVAILDF